jgi:hypothetical protein
MAKSAAKLGKAKGGFGLTAKAAMAALALAALTALPLFLILTPGMMPTLITLFVDRQQPRHLSYTVGIMNFAGVLPFLLALAKGNLSMSGAARLLSDPTTWIVMYGAAAAGWAICAAMQPLARFCLELQASQKRRALEALGGAIKKEWGEEVAGAAKKQGEATAGG